MAMLSFIDTEIDASNGRLLDLGALRSDGARYHGDSVADFRVFLFGSRYLCGHNLVQHDFRHLEAAGALPGLTPDDLIDTLYLSALLFPRRPHHALLKDDKLAPEARNNPLNDAQKAYDLFQDEVAAFRELPGHMQALFQGLLHDRPGFAAFFQYLGCAPVETAPVDLIRAHFEGALCAHAPLADSVRQRPVELAYCLALLHAEGPEAAFPPWVLRNFPGAESLWFLLRNQPCPAGCGYCDQAFDIRAALRRYFGFEDYRRFGAVDLQAQAVQAAVDNQSLLVIFPTGGGKSLTFQVPALIAGAQAQGLTVVISPLQSLMKDQVDKLEGRGLTQAVTINGALDPIERAKAFERVENGSAQLLYLAPESLRSRSIERLLLGRKVVRFVVDEAHCFSTWGQDFRVDYLYIAPFIRRLQTYKQLDQPIPVSCFTATAKPSVIADIKAYFQRELGLDLQLFATQTPRTNLRYQVIPIEGEEKKYDRLRRLIEAKACPTIVYVARTRRAEALAAKLSEDGYRAAAYHGKMDKGLKAANQEAFMRGEIPIMVATSAFGMGVDKDDVGMVVHYEISDSLENYVQEAGRAGRDARIQADCYVLFDEEDLTRHFILLNQTKLSLDEIQQIWRAIKDLTRFRSRLSQSALEIARAAGWDEQLGELETRVTTAIAALEAAGYLKRGQNLPRVYADSIRVPNAEEAIARIQASPQLAEGQKEQATRIIKALISARSRHRGAEAAESRVDYLADRLGMPLAEVIQLVSVLREEEVLADAKDLTAFVRGERADVSARQKVRQFFALESWLLDTIGPEGGTFDLKDLNEAAAEAQIEGASLKRIQTILNYWSIRRWVARTRQGQAQVGLRWRLDFAQMQDGLALRRELAQQAIQYIHRQAQGQEAELVRVIFSVHALKQACAADWQLFERKLDLAAVEDTLFYLSRIGALQIEGGFLVTYNRLSLERLEANNRVRYKQEDYQQLAHFYQNRIAQIHIAGAYARKMVRDHEEALRFVEDYFQLEYPAFVAKYFPGQEANELRRPLTRAKFGQIFGQLSPAQLAIVNDQQAQHIAVAAGPGSGKTRVLVHKLASLLMMEEVKHEQLLMLTFSRAAANEFRQRLRQLIGHAVGFVPISTFHAYCFHLLGRHGSLEQVAGVVPQAVAAIEAGEVETSALTKMVLVIDEAQDMDEPAFALVRLLMAHNPDMRVIMVGDDDQNIYAFRGSSAGYLMRFIQEQEATLYELVDNYRSRANLVAFTNQYVATLDHRLKQTPIQARDQRSGALSVTQYASPYFLPPFFEAICQGDRSGTTGVLTRTNAEAHQLAAQLKQAGYKARLVQDKSGFSLFQLREVQAWWQQLQSATSDPTFSAQQWQAAWEAFVQDWGESPHLTLCEQMKATFDALYPRRRYRSDFEDFLRESQPEDFLSVGQGEFFVSTLHKAKGKEFDQVYLLLQPGAGFDPRYDTVKRQLYVAMTRARQGLHIHYHGDFLAEIEAEGLVYRHDAAEYDRPQDLSLDLDMTEVRLDYFAQRQDTILGLRAGAALRLYRDEGLMDAQGRPVLVFSEKGRARLGQLAQQGYQPTQAMVQHQVFWQKAGHQVPILIVLPRLWLRRGPSGSMGPDQA